MQLRHMSLPLLIGAAGGDPWRVDATLQSGRPAVVDELAQAFRDAGGCTADSSEAFTQARQRFREAWRRESGEHPINDSREVQRATAALRLQPAQLATIAADLEAIAAALAEAQQAAAKAINALEIQLQDLDNLIGAYQAQDADTSDLEHAAIEETVTVLHVVAHIRDGYAAALQTATTTLLNDGYDPIAVHGYDGDGRPTQDQQTVQAVDGYGAAQRDQDRAVLADPGAPAPAKDDAAARLRDDAVVTNPQADPESRRLAGERLDDFRLAVTTGPVPPDLLLGGDARTRAQARLDFQKGLEQGRWGDRRLSADEATWLIDAAEQEARVLATRQAIDALIRQAGMTPNGATRFVSDLVHGRAAQLLNAEAGGAANVIGGAAKGLEATAPKLPTGKHWGSGVAYTSGDLAAIEKLAGRLGRHSGVLGAATGLYDVLVDHKPPLEVGVSSAVSSIGAAEAAELGAAIFSPLGPPGMFAGALVFGVAGSFGGEYLAGRAFELGRN